MLFKEYNTQIYTILLNNVYLFDLLWHKSEIHSYIKPKYQDIYLCKISIYISLVEHKILQFLSTSSKSPLCIIHNWRIMKILHKIKATNMHT